MITTLKKLLAPQKEEKRDFSSFFNRASVEERRKLMEEVTRKANEDQRALLQEYKQVHQKTA